jgi:hypothetical protein
MEKENAFGRKINQVASILVATEQSALHPSLFRFWMMNNWDGQNIESCGMATFKK